ncbi:hypothetical protein [Agromyces neolithicus]|uniref:ATP-binding protein n=1 Tax=Agromyces neolithicus TaxID=269420 RepID=A0ABN2M935_9MICO
MAKVDLLAPSRAGDKFHYYWAARKALELLRPGTTRTELVVEGRAPSDRETDADEVIDVAEYFTSDAPQRVIYSQLKHSTRQLNIEWTLSDFGDVISRFATICADLLSAGSIPIAAMAFRIVTNRPIAASVAGTVQRLVSGGSDNPSTRALRRYIKPLGTNANAFLERLEFDDTEVGVLEQVDLLSLESSSFLVAASSDLMLRLKEVVADRASTEGHPPIRRADVLIALRVDENDLLPAPTVLDATGLIDRVAYEKLRDRIVETPGSYVVHAAGGVGKSSFSAWLHARGNQGHEVVVFDCFAGGSYREVSQLRHDHRRGLTQIANELATRNLCDPLLPTGTADTTQYMRAFLVRVSEAAAVLDRRGKRLIIVVDAADNSVMAAESQIGSTAFAPDLLREKLPENVRIVLTARTERAASLAAPPQAIHLPLDPLTAAESRRMLSLKFDGVTELQASEFHEATWGNPRVQAFAIGAGTSVSSVLGGLSKVGLSNATDALDELIRSTLATVRDSHGPRAPEIDRICAVLACLRPVIRLATVAEIAEVPASLVESFLLELPFSVQRVGETLHFRDEPTETYFRHHLMPDAETLDLIVARVERLAPESFYLASALPQLLWESNRHASLIDLALADRALPAASNTEAREVAENRAVYALRAAIELQEWGSASRLALRAGRLNEASTVRDRVVSENCDLAGFALDLEMADRYVASRTLSMGNPGFNLAREGLLLAMRADSRGAALGRLRSAHEWMLSYSRQPDRAADQPRIAISDIADVLLARLLLHGPTGLEQELSRFRDWVHFGAMRIVARRFMDQGDLKVLEEFLQATGHRLAVLACCQEIWACDRILGDAAAHNVAAILKRSRARFPIEDRDDPDVALGAVLGAVVLTLETKELSKEIALRVLMRHLPAQPPAYLGDPHHRDRLAYALGSALAAALKDSALNKDSLASERVRDGLKIESTSDRETRDYRVNVVPTIPWLNAWAISVLGDPIDMAALRPSLKRKLPAGHDAPRLHARWMLRVQTSFSSKGLINTSSLERWVRVNGGLLGDAVLIRAARALRYQSPKRRAVAGQVVRFVETRSRSQVEGAAARTALYVDLARTCWALEPENARAYFLEALDSAELVGDQIHLQWRATTEIARLAAPAQPSTAQMVRIARASEAIQRADLLELSPAETLRAIAAVDPVAAIDITSRWRDRRIATLEQSLAGLLREDGDALRAYPDLALAVAALHSEALGTLLTNSSTSQQEAALMHAISVLHRRGVSPESDQALCTFASTLGRPLTFRPWRGDQRSYTDLGYKEPKSDRRDRRRRARRTRQQLAALHYSDQLTWQQAFALSTYENGLDRTAVFTIALPPIATNDRSRAIRSLADAIEDRYMGQAAIEALHALEGVTAPEQRAIRDVVGQIVTRFAFDVVTSSYQALPLPEAALMLDQPVEHVMERSFSVWTRAEEPTSVEGYYAMSVNLAELAGSEATLPLLDDALEQFDAVIRATSLDLPPVDVPGLSNSIAAATARLVWGALADPATATRWDAAFAVLGLLRVGQHDVIIELSALARAGGDCQAGDPAFEFYALHADWFLLIALRRAAVSSELVDRLRPFVPFLERVLAAPTHAILTPLALQVTAAIDERTPTSWPPLEPVQTEWSYRGRDQFNKPEVDYRFDWDFRENQIHHLADAFGLDREKVEREASDVITNTWRRAERGERDEDARHRIGVFRHEETYDRYANPPVHDLDHYLSLHALMTVAGQAAETYPARQHEGDDVDEFTHRLQEHRIVRPDGYWIGETRVSPPFHSIEEGGDDHLWRWGVQPEDFSSNLLHSDTSFVCWAAYDSSGYSRSESVRVESVLAPAALASAYTRALQLDRDLWDFRIPTTREVDEDDDDLLESDGKTRDETDPFTLQPWVRLVDGRDGLDKHDRAVGNLTYPPPLLDAEIVNAVEDATPPRVTWRDGDERVVAWSEAWDDHGSRDRGRSGSRLTMTYGHLDTLLTARELALVSVVSIDRRLSGRSREGIHEEGIDRVGHYFRVFEYRPERGWIDFRGRPQTR